MVLAPGSSSTRNENNTTYHATLDVNGIFWLYSHTYDNESSKLNISSLSWSVLDNPCEVKGVCGFNSFCTFDDAQLDCLCLLVTDFVDPNHSSLGCVRNFSEEVCKGGKENAAFYNINTIENLVLANRAYFRQSMSTEECRKSCLEDYDCGEALFKSSTCKKHNLPPRYVRRDTGEQSKALSHVRF
nr:g-type lectin s-receptor-like serine/threonine-protein kinase lecrk4 [Quercus suber]